MILVDLVTSPLLPPTMLNFEENGLKVVVLEPAYQAFPCSFGAKKDRGITRNGIFGVLLAPFYVSGKLSTYPSPKPTFCPK